MSNESQLVKLNGVTDKELHIGLQVVIDKGYDVREFTSAMENVNVSNAKIALEVDVDIEKSIYKTSLLSVEIKEIDGEFVDLTVKIPYYTIPNLNYYDDLHVWFVLGNVSYILEVLVATILPIVKVNAA